jgi:uncharacterized protein YhhL (DUF1145 family)
MKDLLKASAVVIYLMAVIAVFGVLPAGLASALKMVAGVLLALHVLEVLFALRYIKRHQGPLIDSIALTLLFGFLHWLPLARR